MSNDSLGPDSAVHHTSRGGSADASRMSFGDHLDELRNCLLRALAGVVVTTVVSLVFGQQVLEIICRPLLIVQHKNGLTPSLQVLAPTAAFTAYLKIGFLCGLIVAMPWVLYQLWRFVMTGLYAHERRFMRMLVPTSLGLFVAGVLFLYFIVLPIVLSFFITFNKSFGVPSLQPTTIQRWLLPGPADDAPVEAVQATLDVPVLSDDPTDPKPGQVWVNTSMRRLMVQTGKGVLSAPLEPGATPTVMQSQFAIDFYISFVLMLALAFGIAFETPVVVFFLAWSGIVPVATMVQGRRYVLFATVIAAAILTPPDVISQLLLAAPMYLLFEAGLLVARATSTKTAPASG